jgi:hypothetical protein
VLRDRRSAGTKIRRDLADGAGAFTQQAENFAARGVGDRPEHRSALRASLYEHVA